MKMPREILRNKRSLFASLLLFVFFLCTLNAYGWLFQTRFEGDVASRMLLVMGPQLQLGNPYVDLWEIIPPGYVSILSFWSNIIGRTPLHFVLLHYLLLLGSVPLLFLLLKKFLSGIILPIAFVATSLVLYSPAIHSMYVSSELLGVFFSLTALVSLYYLPNKYQRISVSAALFLIAGQMKDPFLFGGLAVIPIFLWELLSSPSKREKRAVIISGIAGTIVPIVFFGLFLISKNALFAYLQVLQDKSQLNNSINLESLTKTINGIYSIFQYNYFPVQSLLLIIIILLLILYLFQRSTFAWKNKSLQVVVNTKFKFSELSFSLTKNQFTFLSIFGFIIGSFFGMMLQGKLSTHYLIQGVIPLYIGLSLVASFFIFHIIKMLSVEKKSLTAFILSFIITCLILCPKLAYIRSYSQYWNTGYLESLKSPSYVLSYFKNRSSPELSGQQQMEKFIMERVAKDECILHIYGWHVASTYIYTERKPCTRFFLPNIITKDWQEAEFRHDILDNPPAAVVYGTIRSDFNVLNFESEVLPIEKVLESCYYAENKFVSINPTFPVTLYLPNGTPAETKRCWEEVGKRV